MLNKKTSLFSLDLRIEQDIIKLKVYEEDALADIVERLFASLSLKSSSKDKLKNKLEEQFRKILQKKELSQVIKNKLDSLLDESKIVIMAIDTDRNEPSLNETPFKILQESAMNGRKASQ